MKPFLKWVGGKGRVLPQILPLLPPDVADLRHVEPFAGGAAMFFAREPQRALLADANHRLIATYRIVRDQVDYVIRELEKLAPGHDAAQYARVRARYNDGIEDDAEYAAAFIYLNRTCFNGLYRVNSAGEFNVPMGRYRNPRILDAEGLRAVSRALVAAELRAAPFDVTIAVCGRGDFVYMDPPYVPVSATASFTAYDAGGFGPGDQRWLRVAFADVSKRGARCMLLNSDTPEVRELYRGFRIDRIEAPRSINCDATKRGPVGELVVRNY